MNLGSQTLGEEYCDIIQVHGSNQQSVTFMVCFLSLLIIDLFKDLEKIKDFKREREKQNNKIK